VNAPFELCVRLKTAEVKSEQPQVTILSERCRSRDQNKTWHHSDLVDAAMHVKSGFHQFGDFGSVGDQS
jgi:hypothetical protein